MSIEMYPLVGNAQYYETFDAFAELREAAEALPIGLNQIQSWFIYDEQDGDWGALLAAGELEQREFSLCICMPRKTAFTIWTTHQFERADVEAWIETWVFPHVRRWYGMPEARREVRELDTAGGAA